MYSKMTAIILLIPAIILGMWTSHMGSVYWTGNRNWLAALGLITFLLFYFSSGWVWKVIKRAVRGFNYLLDNTSIEILLGGTAGLLVGVLLGLLSTYPLSMIKGAGTYLAIATFFLCGYLGLRIGTHRAEEVWGLFPTGPVLSNDNSSRLAQRKKVLDTSAIIDGRIYDVCLSKFLEGPILVPLFVIEELQHIADSSDNLRRNKGRRGLELLAKMQEHSSIKIEIIEGNYPEEKEVDMKLIRLCKDMDASIVTNDYNLNKVAELQGIQVLNINELTNAVKMVVYPGETMHISIIKEGKEPGQGVGYLEDGTMVVVEDAQNFIGNNLEVVVTSVFQTAAGRMIFSRKIKEEISSTGMADRSMQGVRVQEVNFYG